MPPSYEEFYPPSSAITFTFVFLAGLILPAILIPIVAFSGYSEIIEELAKAAVVFFLIFKLPSSKTRLLAGLAFGFLFGVSESFFYLNNLFQLGSLGLFWSRLLSTVPMHMITVAVVVLSGLINKKLILFGLLAAIILHLLFNTTIIQIF